MNGDHYQKLSLALMSVDAIQRQVKEQLDALPEQAEGPRTWPLDRLETTWHPPH